MIHPVCALTPKAAFRGNDLKNPVNRKVERRLAILNSAGLSVVTGAVTTAIGRSFTSSWRNAGILGACAGIATMAVICPRMLYRSGINAYAKEKEMDVFTKEKEVQKKLLNDVDEAIENHHPDLQGKIENYAKARSAEDD